jgi:hypothetical protein
LDRLILTLRGQPVMLDRDLADIYGVPTFRFNEAIKRNAGRFPDDFRFQLTFEEAANLISQFAISSAGRSPGPRGEPASSSTAAGARRHGGLRKRPWAFTEHGAIMAATILHSPRAVAMSLYVVRAFVRMRRELQASTVLEARLAKIEQTLLLHDAGLRDLYAKIKPLLLPPPAPPAKELGFHTRMKTP